jgi:hypothetical protein
MQDKLSVYRLLEVAREFDGSGGISVGLVAWELTLEEPAVAAAVEHAQEQGWLKPAGHDQIHGEPMWRLTLKGRAAASQHPGRP